MAGEKRQKLAMLREKLANLNDTERGNIEAKGLILTVEGRSLSLQNTILLYLQQPNGVAPTVVAGYKQWQRAGKQVRRGEHSSIIWFPLGTKDKDGDITDVQHFGTANVFDVSQVEEMEEVLQNQ